MPPREIPPVDSRLPRIVGIVLLVALSSCSRDSTERGPLPTVMPDSFDCNAPVTTVLYVAAGGQSPRMELITTQDDWCSLWSKIYSGDPTPPACDTGLIDFQTQAALTAGIIGNDSCTRIRITCVHRDPHDNLTVVYEVSTAKPGELCLMVVVNPMHVVSVDLPVGQVTFVQDHSTP